MSKKKYILISVIIVVLALVYFSIISPVYKNYNDATFVKNFAEDKENVFVYNSYGLIKIKKGSDEISDIKKINFTMDEIVVDENDEKWFISFLDDTIYSFKNNSKVTKHNSPFKIDKNKNSNFWENIKIDQIGTKWILVNTDITEDLRNPDPHFNLYTFELYSYDSFGNWKKYPFPEKFTGGEPDMFVDEYDNIIFLIKNNVLVNNSITSSYKLLFLENHGAPGDLGEINSFRTREWSQLDFPSRDFSLNNSFNDKEHNIWITGNSNGNYSLYRFEYPDFIKYNFSKEIKALDSDTNGKIWIATEDGIEILNEKKSLIPKKEISKMFIDSNNKKWIEERRNGIECYDGKEWKSYDFEIFKYVVKDFFNNLF
jgi:hypothetical protein